MSMSLIALLWACEAISSLALMTLLPSWVRKDKFTLMFVVLLVLGAPVGFPISCLEFLLSGPSNATRSSGGANERRGKKHMSRVRDLGCIACRNAGLGATAASAHHINAKGVGMKVSDKETIPLCPIHHQYGDGSARFKGHIAVHRGLESFERRYGTERELLAQTLRELEITET